MQIVRAADRWIFTEQTPESTTRKVAKSALIIGWVALSAFNCYVPVIVTLNENNGTVWQRAGSVISSTGVAFDWFSLTAYGGVIYINDAFTQISPEERLLFRKNWPLCVRISQLSLSIILGAATRLASITEAILYNKTRELGIATAVIGFISESGLPALSVWKLLEQIFQWIGKRTGRKRPGQQELEVIRIKLINLTRLTIARNLKSSWEERIAKLMLICKEQQNPAASDIHRIQRILVEIQNLYNNTHNSEHANCTSLILHKAPQKFVQVICTGSVAGLFILDALLAKTAVELCQGSLPWVVIAMGLAWLPLSPIAVKMTYEASGKIFDAALGCFKEPSVPNTFSDEFYPKISKSLKILLFLCSLLQYDEQISLSRLYDDVETTRGKFLAYSNIIACSMLISESFYLALDELIHAYAKRRNNSEQMKNFALLKEKTDKLVLLFEQLRPVDLSKILDAIDDDELKTFILGSTMTITELHTFAHDTVEEKQRLINEAT